MVTKQGAKGHGGRFLPGTLGLEAGRCHLLLLYSATTTKRGTFQPNFHGSMKATPTQLLKANIWGSVLLSCIPSFPSVSGFPQLPHSPRPLPLSSSPLSSPKLKRKPLLQSAPLTQHKAPSSKLRFHLSPQHCPAFQSALQLSHHRSQPSYFHATSIPPSLFSTCPQKLPLSCMVSTRNFHPQG